MGGGDTGANRRSQVLGKRNGKVLHLSLPSHQSRSLHKRASRVMKPTSNHRSATVHPIAPSSAADSAHVLEDNIGSRAQRQRRRQVHRVRERHPRPACETVRTLP